MNNLQLKRLIELIILSLIILITSCTRNDNKVYNEEYSFEYYLNETHLKSEEFKTCSGGSADWFGYSPSSDCDFHGDLFFKPQPQTLGGKLEAFNENQLHRLQFWLSFSGEFDRLDASNLSLDELNYVEGGRFDKISYKLLDGTENYKILSVDTARLRFELSFSAKFLQPETKDTFRIRNGYVHYHPTIF